jgi:hypothetical protein
MKKDYKLLLEILVDKLENKLCGMMDSCYSNKDCERLWDHLMKTMPKYVIEEMLLILEVDEALTKLENEN